MILENEFQIKKNKIKNEKNPSLAGCRARGDFTSSRAKKTARGHHHDGLPAQFHSDGGKSARATGAEQRRVYCGLCAAAAGGSCGQRFSQQIEGHPDARGKKGVRGCGRQMERSLENRAAETLAGEFEELRRRGICQDRKST